MSVSASPSKEFVLDPDCELRFEIESKNEKVKLEVLTGLAELFGTELVKGKSYEFGTGDKVAVFTYHGCTVRVTGNMDVCYVAKETPMVQYLNSHSALEALRDKAEEKNTRGPIVMVVGPTDVGKTTVCRLFLNYAVRQGRSPFYVDLDPGQGNISIPGTISALLVERPASVESGFSQKAPLVFHYGHKSPGDNMALYKNVTSRLADVMLDALNSNKKARVSGMVINTCGWVKGGGYKYILHAAKEFEVGAVFVLDQERLYNELLRDMPNFVKVVFLPKSGGVVERPKNLRAETRDFKIREYFYGGSRSPLYPHRFEVKWSDVKIFKIGAPALPDSCMPLGMKAQDNMTKMVVVQPGQNILHHILAISFAENADEDVINANVLGFICVESVDADQQTMTVLSPQPRPLPNTVLLLSDLQFLDNH